MGGKSGQDFGQVAATQGAENRAVVRDQLYANRPDQYSPWGYQKWTQSGSGTKEDPTRWSQTTGLTPELQNIYDKQLAMQEGRTDVAGMMTGRLGGEYQNAINYEGMGPRGAVPSGQFTIPEDIQRSKSYANAPSLYAGQQQINLGYGSAPNVNAPTQQAALDYSGAPAMGDTRDMRSRAENAVYNKGMSRMAPEFESQRASLETKMRNQGLRPGDAAWKSQTLGLDNKQSDAQAQLQSQAVMQGMGEQNQQYNQNMGQRGMATSETDRQGAFGNQARQNQFQMQLQRRGQATDERLSQGQFSNQAKQDYFNMQAARRGQWTGEMDSMAQFGNAADQQAFQQALAANNQNYGQALGNSRYANEIRNSQITEEMNKRGYNLNEINALLSGQQVGLPQMGNFQPAGQAQPAPYMQGAAQDASSAAANNPMNALIGAAGTVAGAALSDRRMKTNIRRIGTRGGFPWYSYNLIRDGSAHEGVMADEIPQQYTVDMGGITLVNYAALLGE